MGRRKAQYKRQKWTPEEVEKLKILSERYTEGDVARMLKRSPSSIGNKRRELGIDSFTINTDKWNFKQITEAVGVSIGVVHKTWVKHGLKFTKKGNLRMVDEDELLRFMKNNPNLWNAAKCDYYLFYQYPWFMEKYEKDKQVPVEHRGYYWTDYQKQQFESLARKGCTHQQIADAIGKTKRAVAHYSSKIARKGIA